MKEHNPQNLPLISVIVPIYQVEEYLPRCIESIINQTYRNLEIILVDDGSYDNGGMICNQYALSDKRIKVIHQANQGLSEARNHGLDICTGEYIGFVDGDDCIHPEMYQRLYNDICKYNTRLAFCQTNVTSQYIPEFPEMKEDTVCMSSTDVTCLSLSKSMWWSACTKLYHYTLFENLRYSKGLTHEDYPMTIRVYDRCDKIVVNYNKLYNYCKRPDSITTSKFSIRSFDQIETSKDVLVYMERNHHEWVDYAENIYLTTVIKVLNHLLCSDYNMFVGRCDELFHLVDERYKTAINNPFVIRPHKLMLFLSHYWHWGYKQSIILYNRYRK